MRLRSEMFVHEALRWIMKQLADIAARLLINTLTAGPVPKHVAFIMDGHRRYARSHQKKILKGHNEGYLVFRAILENCFQLGITCVSGYLFSILNFNRPKEEVDGLMALTEKALLDICKNGDLLDKYDVRLNIIGRTDLLPESVRKAACEAERKTRNNHKAILNLCIPYTSRDEMTTAVQACVREAMKPGPDTKRVITEDDIHGQLLTTRCGSPPLDILIRTGGDKRLSDFLLWQCCENTQIQFVKPLWPELGLFDLIPIILDYQIKLWQC